jgi:hypothetical protein
MRRLIAKLLLTVGSLGLLAALPTDAKAQSAAGTPDYAIPRTAPGNWQHYYYGPPYYNWRGHEQWRNNDWQWQQGRYFYPGYRYYAYPQYGTEFYGGGHYSFAPGYYYPRQY